MPPTLLTLRQLNRATLARQMLLAREKTTVVGVAERLVGLQAQWPAPPFVGLWTRIEGFSRSDLASALQCREVVRGTMFRGTIHVVSTQDYLRFRPLLQPMLTRAMQSILGDRMTGIDVEKLSTEATIFLKKEPATFERIRDHLLALHPGADERAMGLVVRMQLPLIQMPREATAWSFPGNADFALASSWLERPIGPDEATLDGLILAYLGAFGPATVKDFQTWSGVRNAKESFATLRPRLVTFVDEKKRELFDLPEAPRPDASTDAPVRFLPEFDNLLLGHDDRTRILPEAHRAHVFQAGLRVLPTFTIDGFAAGTWKIEKKKKVATMTLTSLEPLSKKRVKQVTDEGEKLVRFVEPEATTYEIRVG